MSAALTRRLRFALPAALALLALAPRAVLAVPVQLLAVRNPLPTGAAITWSGVAAVDQYRTSDKRTIRAPASLVGTVAAPPWSDLTVPASVLYYDVEPLCGNGRLDAGEECDDGNTTAGDGCSVDCKTEIGGPCDPDGTYTILTGGPVAYTCCLGIVDVSLTSFTLTGDGIQINGAPVHPVPMEGNATSCPRGSFANEAVIPGKCNEHYGVSGTFTTADTWTGTYRIWFDGPQCDCFGLDPCFDQTFPITASR